METLRVPWIAKCKYPKIQTLYERDPDNFRVRVGKLRKPEFATVRTWLVTEKIDGTNIRVILCPDGRVSFRGRTDRAQLYPKLVDVLNHMFPEGTTQALYPDQKEDTPYPWTILYGEGYGEKIQKGGGDYREGQSFRLFDVLIIPQEAERGWWQEWDTVREMAGRLGIETVPFNSRLEVLPTTARDLLAWFPTSVVAITEKCEHAPNFARLPEGIVARTNPLLFNRLGERVMWKLKLRDFPDGTR